MNKLDMKTKNIVDENIEYINNKFPNVIKESENGLKIDFDALKQELSKTIIDDNKEKYQLTWPGKKQAILNANTPTNNTLKPLKEKSVDFDNTENIYIEGDNLEVLKILQESYLNKIKCIYIDPPYNTGNDFIYNDNFNKKTDDELLESGQVDESGNRLVSNNQSNGRYHSDWLSMMYPRLKLARNLLIDKGIVFISIGDDELPNLTKVCDEIFGDSNKVAIVPRIAKRTSDKGTYFRPTKDYILVYSKNINLLEEFGIKKDRDEKDYNITDEDGRKYKKSGASLFQPSLDSRPNQRYYIEAPDGSLIIPPGNVFPNEKKDGAKVKPISNSDKVWRWSVDTYINQKHLLIFTQGSSKNPLLDENGNQSKWNVYPKVYFDEDVDSTLHPEDVIYDYPNSQATKEIIDLGMFFSFAKPTGLIKYLLKLVDNEKMIVLDFFSGSATTAHAVMQLNAEDGGNRKYIMVQLPEETNGKSEAYKAGYKNICEIGQERIRRATKKIKDETNADIDYGFRVYKVDSSNMENVYYTPNQYSQEQLSMFESNIKEGRTSEDLLTQIMLDLGLTLDLKIEERELRSNKIYYVANNSLVACFDNNFNIDNIDDICKINPLKIVFRDSCFRTDNDKINVSERIKKLSPETEISVI